jgi:succinate-semialdehyde dehydrogenase/glutarate-semialdehyde dehydrogenase
VADYEMLIGARKVLPANDEWIDVINPATKQVVGRVPKGTRADADAALQAADRAFQDWKVLPTKKRSDIIKKAVAYTRQSIPEIAEALTREQGKPLSQAKDEVKGALDTIEYMAEEAHRILGEIIPTDSNDRLSFVILQPVGVVSAIVPFNYPINLLSWKLAPALASGCTVVAKPASQTPISAILLIGKLLEGGLPPGTVNVVTGSGSTVGQELVDNPLSQKVSFTGSTEMGRIIMRDAAKHLKKVGLELGGSNPLIVLKDADLDEAVKGGVLKAFRNTGQVCTCIRRIYVEQPVYEEYVKRFTEATAKLTIGDGLANPDVDLGPLMDEPARQRVQEAVQDAVKKGARICHGGQIPPGEAFTHGYFYEPTVLANVDHTMQVMLEEIFGPIAPIMPVANFDEAIEKANDSPFGLAGYIYTTKLAYAIEAGRRMDCGSIGINETSFTGAPYPFPAWKQSGPGVENSHHGLREFLRVKHIRVHVPKE